LPPGVETLTNLATTWLHRARLASTTDEEEALTKLGVEYCERAITLNPAYEYAYYRLSQLWEIRAPILELRKVMSRLPKPVRISEFKEMYQKYQVPEPK